MGITAELIRLCSPNHVAWFERCPGSLVCGENADSTRNVERSIPRKPMVVNRETILLKPSRFPPLRKSVEGTRRPTPNDSGPKDESVAGAKTGVLNEPWERESIMAQDDEHDRLFSLAEANHLIPQLNTRLTSVRQAKAVLVRTKEDIQKASAKASYGGGSTVGPLYISSLQQISANIQAIQEMGVVVKDLDQGLCDFPHLRDGRVVFLCWKLGEQEIKWWHETTDGYKDRCPLEDSVQ